MVSEHRIHGAARLFIPRTVPTRVTSGAADLGRVAPVCRSVAAGAGRTRPSRSCSAGVRADAEGGRAARPARRRRVRVEAAAEHEAPLHAAVRPGEAGVGGQVHLRLPHQSRFFSVSRGHVRVGRRSACPGPRSSRPATPPTRRPRCGPPGCWSARTGPSSSPTWSTMSTRAERHRPDAGGVPGLVVPQGLEGVRQVSRVLTSAGRAGGYGHFPPPNQITTSRNHKIPCPPTTYVKSRLQAAQVWPLATDPWALLGRSHRSPEIYRWCHTWVAVTAVRPISNPVRAGGAGPHRRQFRRRLQHRLGVEVPALGGATPARAPAPPNFSWAAACRPPSPTSPSARGT